MSQLPNVNAATIDESKITKYLFDLNHSIGVGKAKFFFPFGFSLANWIDLRSSLLSHTQTNSVTKHEATSHGESMR